MLKRVLLINVLFVAACGLKLVKDEKYIATGKFRDEAFKICMSSKKYGNEPQQGRKAICNKDARAFIANAEMKFREYKADEHNYRLCRSRFADIPASDECFRRQQEKYYERELAAYKANLN